MGRFRLLRVMAALGVALTYSSGAYAYEEDTLFVWPKWQKGVDLGLRALSRIGTGANINSPPGDVMINLGGHIWLRHTVDFHVALGIGLGNGTFSYGVGTRLNLIELISDPTNEMITRGLQRGVLARTLKDFMLFISLDLAHYSYKEPDPGSGLDYPTSAWQFIPGAGVQWYFRIKNEFASRFLIETSMGFTKAGASTYLIPAFVLGAELF